jgi:uncharacterized protein
MLTRARVTAVASRLFFCAFASDAYSQSFNCRLAKTPDEVVVCHSSRLSALDEQMASLFFKLRTGLTGTKQQQLTVDQQSWLRERTSCGSDTDCIENAYKKRLNQLMPKPPAGVSPVTSPAETVDCAAISDPVMRLACFDAKSDRQGSDTTPAPSTAQPSSPIAADTEDQSGLYICAEHSDEEDWEFEFHKGPILIPAGTVFDYAGHILADNLQDPRDSAHFSAGGWKGITKEENERRTKLIEQDMSVDQKHTSGLVTIKDVSLTKSKPCALAPAKALLSNQWGWTTGTIVGDSNVYFQIYGLIRRGALDTSFSDDEIPVNQLASRGQLNASVHGTISQSIDIDKWSATQKPDDQPVSGKGNAECWGDDMRQDISCRALTENFLLTMRGATKSEVVKAMNVVGREIDRGLHFLSNYSRGERWGSGDVNFLFDQTGRVSIIFAMVDPPNSDGKPAEFIWNKELLPAGCSDLPDTSMKHCN